MRRPPQTSKDESAFGLTMKAAAPTRMERRLMTATVVVATALIGYVLSTMVGYQPSPAVAGIAYVLLLIVSFAYSAAGRINHERARRLGFRVCPSCHFRLEGLPAEGRCPECGVKYDPQTLQERWMRA